VTVLPLDESGRTGTTARPPAAGAARPASGRQLEATRCPPGTRPDL